MGSFPKNPKKGRIIVRKVRGRKVKFKATGKKKFPQWKIIK